MDRDRRRNPGNGAADLRRHTPPPADHGQRAGGYRRRDTATNTDVVYTVLYVRSRDQGESDEFVAVVVLYAAAGCRVASRPGDAAEQIDQSATKLLGFRLPAFSSFI